ncbi:MAG: glycosyltransferase family 2 protein [Clostridia bacterium]|nr:glycosyltransferase family 2 protein [Clostridia bacterium]
MSFLNAVRNFIVFFNYFCLSFTLFLSFMYVLQMFVSLARVKKDYKKLYSSDFRRYRKSKNLLPISLIVPAYNEQENIVQNVQSLMKISYPQYEIIVVNDGSSDLTRQLMISAFEMTPMESAIRSLIPTKRVVAVYNSKKYPNLFLVDKENGGKSDALNAGINASSYPLFTCLDADSRLEKDALLLLSLSFIKDSKTVVAGGIVRIANGSRIIDGEFSGFNMPKKLVERFQIVEYYRSFLSGRVFWSSTNSMLVVSGAFGLFRKQTVIDVGGYKTNTIGEDMEIIVRIHRYMRENKLKYKIIFNEASVCWTQGPMSMKDIRSQRRRWQIGLFDSLLTHRKMFLNPRYGFVGLASIPYNWIFELFGAPIETIGYLLIPFSLLMGELNMFFFVTFFLLSAILGVMLSEGSLVLEQLTHKGTLTAKQSLAISVYAILENFGYRQMISLFRVEGLIKYRKMRKTWGKIKRKEFEE